MPALRHITPASVDFHLDPSVEGVRKLNIMTLVLRGPGFARGDCHRCFVVYSAVLDTLLKLVELGYESAISARYLLDTLMNRGSYVAVLDVSSLTVEEANSLARYKAGVDAGFPERFMFPHILAACAIVRSGEKPLPFEEHVEPEFLKTLSLDHSCAEICGLYLNPKEKVGERLVMLFPLMRAAFREVERLHIRRLFATLNERYLRAIKRIYRVDDCIERLPEHEPLIRKHTELNGRVVDLAFPAVELHFRDMLRVYE